MTTTDADLPDAEAHVREALHRAARRARVSPTTAARAVVERKAAELGRRSARTRSWLVAAVAAGSLTTAGVAITQAGDDGVGVTTSPADSNGTRLAPDGKIAPLYLEGPSVRYEAYGQDDSGWELTFSAPGGSIDLLLEKSSPSAFSRQLADLRDDAADTESLTVRGQPALLLHIGSRVVVSWLEGGDTAVQLRTIGVQPAAVDELLGALRSDQAGFNALVSSTKR